MKIDSHQHFWRFNDDDYGWMGEDMAVIKRDRLPDDLAPLIDAVGIDGTVAVQARQCLPETEWLLELADANPFIKGVVGWIDLRSPDVREQLERYSANPKLCGVRHVIHDEPNVRFMEREDFMRGVKALKEFDLAYDLLLRPVHLPLACELVAACPDQRFVLDHISKPLIKDGVMAPWEADIRCLASFENVACKVSGMVTEADWSAWKPSDFAPYMDVVFDCFGTDRTMLGSDWPVCTVAGQYADVMRIPTDYIARFSDDEQADIRGDVAARFYGLNA